MDINEITIGQAKSLVDLFSATTNALPFEMGKKYLIRIVTHSWVGKVNEIIGDYVLLEQASWVADTGRLHKAVKGEFDSNAEIEHVGNAGMNMAAVIDFVQWNCELPTETK